MQGIRVIDMTSVLSGPFCTWLLSTSEVTDSAGHGMSFVPNPIADPALRETAAPALGQHSREILAEIGYSEAEIEKLGVV